MDSQNYPVLTCSNSQPGLSHYSINIMKDATFTYVSTQSAFNELFDPKFIMPYLLYFLAASEEAFETQLQTIQRPELGHSNRKDKNSFVSLWVKIVKFSKNLNYRLLICQGWPSQASLCLGGLNLHIHGRQSDTMTTLKLEK